MPYQTSSGRTIPSADELRERLAKMTPIQRTRYYNKCVTNTNTPDEVVDFLMHYKRENKDQFASDSSLSFMQNRGLSFDSWKKSDSWRRNANRGASGIGTINVGDYEDGRDAYREFGSSTVDRYRSYGRSDYGRRNYGQSSGSYYGRQRDNGYRVRKPVSEERSFEEINQIMEGLGSNVRRTQYFNAVMGNKDSNKGTVATLEDYRKLNPGMFATEKQIDSFKKRNSRPLSEARTANDIAQTMGNIRSRSARTRYFMSVISNPESNETTKKNLAKFRNDHPEMFVSDESAMRFRSSRAYAKPEDFAAMSGKEKHFFTSARGRSRAQNSSYALKVLTNPNSNNGDRIAITRVIRRYPQMFFKTRFSGGRNHQ